MSAECETCDGDLNADLECPWCQKCEECESLTRERDALIRESKRTAIIVNDGHLIACGPIGCLYVYGGSINCTGGPAVEMTDGS